MNTSVIEAIERQKTTNLYDASKSIPDDEIRELVRLATFSPTAFHLQNWRFIAVRSPEAKARLRAVAADQPKVTEAAMKNRWTRNVRSLCQCSPGRLICRCRIK